MDNLKAVFDTIDQGRRGFITEADLRLISNENQDIDQIVSLLNLGPRDSLNFDQFRSKIRRIFNHDDEVYEGVSYNEVDFEKARSSPLIRKKKASGSPDLGGRRGYEEVINLLKQVLCRLEDNPPSGKRWPQHDEEEEVLKRRLEAVEVEKQAVQLRLDLASDRNEALEKQLVSKEADLKRARQDLINLTANFEAIVHVVEGLKATLKSELMEAKSMASKTSYNNSREAEAASLQKEREWLAQEKLAFSLERIAFDSYRSETVAEAAEAATVKMEDDSYVDTCIEACEDMDLNCLVKFEAIMVENASLRKSLASSEAANASLKKSYATAIK